MPIIGAGLGISSSFVLSREQRSQVGTLQEALDEFKSLKDRFEIDPENLDAAFGGLLGDSTRVSSGGITQGTLNFIGTVTAAGNVLDTVTSNLLDLRNLAVLGQDSTLSSDEREVLGARFEDLQSQTEDLLSNSRFEGTPLFEKQTLTTVISAGGLSDSIKLKDTTLTTLGVKDVDVSGTEESGDAISKIDSAISQVETRKSELLADLSRLTYYVTDIAEEKLKADAFKFRIGQITEAQSAVAQIGSDILKKSSLSEETQANLTFESSLNLLLPATK